MKLFSLIFQGEVHPAAEEKLIPAESYSQLLEAHEIIEKAQADAKALHEKTKKECAALKEKAKKQGLEEGMHQFNEQMLKMDQEIKQLRHHLQRMVLPIALKAAKKIVGKELALFPETIVDIVIQALAPATQSRRVTIFVNKQDKEILEEQKPKIMELLKQTETLAIQEKSGVAPGGCLIQTDSGMINATIDNQWSSLERAFEKYLTPKTS